MDDVHSEGRTGESASHSAGLLAGERCEGAARITMLCLALHKRQGYGMYITPSCLKLVRSLLVVCVYVCID